MPSSQNLPLAALQQIEAAALQLLSAVRQAGNGFSSSNILPLRPARLSTVADLCNSFLLAKARAGRSERYLRTLRAGLARASRRDPRQRLFHRPPILCAVEPFWKIVRRCDSGSHLRIPETAIASMSKSACARLVMFVFSMQI